ncbi:MAG: cyclodeaminase/cyclohydrolase family protein [Spirochaetes bacterium]|nr:cyclodeaminase/cyclohydrolase family protein [Spirochaetota bacterium]
MYAEKPLRHFIDRLCSESPEPGGGSASALVGAAAAALSGMLAALTVNKKGYEKVRPDMERYLERARRLKDDLLQLLQRDTEAFDDASNAFKLPKGTEEEKRNRAEAIEKGLKKATEVPLAIMEKATEVSRLANDVLKTGNEMAISDGAISALFAEAACIGAMVNVYINFSWMKDGAYIEETEAKIGPLLDETRKTREQALSYTLEKLRRG